MLNNAIKRLQGLRQGAPVQRNTTDPYVTRGYYNTNPNMVQTQDMVANPWYQGSPVQQFKTTLPGGEPLTQEQQPGYGYSSPTTEPTAGAAGGLGTQNRLAMLKNMIMRRIAERMQSPEMQAQLPQQAGRNPGYLANMILGRPVSQVMSGQIQPQGMTAGAVQAAPPPSTSMAPAFTPPPPPTPTTSGAANSGASAPAPSITSNITQSGEGGQTIQSTGSLAWAPGISKWRK